MKWPKEYREIVEEAQHQGWRVREISSGFLLFAPDGVGKVTIHATESDQGAVDHTLTRMRRHGFQWPPKGARQA